MASSVVAVNFVLMKVASVYNLCNYICVLLWGGGLSIQSSVVKLVNLILWQRMNPVWLKLTQVVYGTRTWNGQLVWVRRSKVNVAWGQDGSQKLVLARYLKNCSTNFNQTQQARNTLNVPCVQQPGCKGQRSYEADVRFIGLTDAGRQWTRRVS